MVQDTAMVVSRGAMSTERGCNYCGHAHFETLNRAMRDWEYGVEGDYDYHQCSACGGVQ